MNFSNIYVQTTAVSTDPSWADSQIIVFSQSLIFYCLTLIIPLGTLCNLISLGVLLTRRMRCRPTSWYLIALSVADSLVLLTAMFDYWLKDSHIGIDLVQTSGAFCSGVSYISSASRLFSATVVTTFTADRFIAVVYPLQRSHVFLSSVSQVVLVVISEAVACLFLTSFIPVTIGITETPMGEDCDVKPHLAKIYLVLNIAIVVLGSIVLPIIFICVLNFQIVRTLYKRKHSPIMRKRISSASSTRSQVREGAIATELLAVSTSFVVLNLPYCFAWFIVFAATYVVKDSDSLGPMQDLHAAKIITSAPYYLNYGINFIWYSLCARTFRAELKRCLCCSRVRGDSGRRSILSYRSTVTSFTNGNYDSNGTSEHVALTQKVDTV